MDGHPRQDPAYRLATAKPRRSADGGASSSPGPGEERRTKPADGYAQGVRPTAAEIVARLGLERHPEGGWFRETYRSDEAVATARGTRAVATAILFLVTPASPSRFHRLASDELWVFHGGLPLELITLDADGPANVRLLGDATSARDVVPQALVPAGAWQAAWVAGTHEAGRAARIEGGAGARGGADRTGPPGAIGEERRWSLVSCLVAPGFAYEDFELARREDLLRQCPAEAELILALT